MKPIKCNLICFATDNTNSMRVCHDEIYPSIAETKRVAKKMIKEGKAYNYNYIRLKDEN